MHSKHNIFILGFTAISTPLPQADAEVDEEQGSAYHVKITKPTRKPVDRTTKLAKFVPPKDSDVINLIDADKEPKTAGVYHISMRVSL